ncbi:phage tail protein [Halomonas binhaiensis]|uniref:Phage tail protein n=1 Tax=Halomonas binhaiensis TaxID=2562282 RepID=A0A5C1NB63_9GAMM|nr:phage tail protein [Halomonas binhaiensis]QEM80211.1 phage tail protein [Halomonas binhaiensis]
MALKITITDAGRAEITNAENTGTAPVTITHIALGDAGYPPDPAQVALHSEVKRVSSIAGEVVAANTISVTAKDESNDDYTVREFGLITEHGTLFAVYSQIAPIIEKATPSTLLLTIDVVLADLDAASLSFGDVTFSNPPASKTVAGVVKLSSSVTNPDESVAATALAAKKAYDAAAVRLEKSANLSDLDNKTQARENLGLSEASTQGSTDSRTSPSTTTLLQAKAMNDHRNSGDHDGRYVMLDNGIIAIEFDLATNTIIFRQKSSETDAPILQARSVGQAVRFSVSHDAPELNGDSTGWTIGGKKIVDETRSISTGAGLTGGGNLSSNRTLSIPGSGVQTYMLADYSVSLDKLQNWMITNQKMSADAIESRAIKDGAVTPSKVEPWSLTHEQMAANGIQGRAINSGAIIARHISDNNVYAQHLSQGSPEGDWVRERIANRGGIGWVGTYGFLSRRNGGTSSPGDTLSGSNLQWAGIREKVTGMTLGGSPAGTWRCMGIAANDGSSGDATLWLRIS